MNNKWLTNIILTITLSFLSNVFAGSIIKSSDKKLQKIDYLFMQVAPHGTLTPIDGQKGAYKLTLTQTSNYIEYFTDRPVRKIGLMPLPTFLKIWNKSFRAIPPNVGITAIKHEGFSFTKKPIQLVLELSEPVYDPKNKTVTYIGHYLKGEKVFTKAMKFDDVALVIDGFCASCSGGGF